MTATIGQVVRQLCAAITELDQAAVTADQAREVAERAHARYNEAAQGTAHPRANGAKHQAQLAVDKAGRTARLLAMAAIALTRYVNHIAPGTLPDRSAPDATPSGTQIAKTSTGRGPLSRKLLGRTTAVENADDGLQHAKKIADAIQDAAGAGGVVARRSAEPVIQAASQQGATAGDALLASLTLAIMGLKGAELAASLRRKLKTAQDRPNRDGDKHG